MILPVQCAWAISDPACSVCGNRSIKQLVGMNSGSASESQNRQAVVTHAGMGLLAIGDAALYEHNTRRWLPFVIQLVLLDMFGRQRPSVIFANRFATSNSAFCIAPWASSSAKPSLSRMIKTRWTKELKRDAAAPGPHISRMAVRLGRRCRLESSLVGRGTKQGHAG